MPIFIIIFFIASCGQRSDKNRIQKIVEEWQGKQIVLPDDMTDFLTGDTIDLSDADFTILTYIDSVGCSQCKMKLPLWKEFLYSLDSICDYNIRYLMIVYPSDKSELNYVLKQYQFDYPVYLDVDKRVTKANSFPTETMLQTFLIDRNKNVTAIGNPLRSPHIASLLKGIISGKMSVSTESRNIVTISDNQISLGDILQGEEFSREIVFSNQGNDTVRIQKVVSSCECTELSLPKEYISPGSNIKGVLHFAGDSEIGEFENTLNIYYSDFEYPSVITVSGNIIL